MSASPRPGSVTDRRPQPRSDARRAALLGALDDQLQRSSLEAVSIAEISRAAGVTRSAFYFYFESKAAATAALMESFYAAALTAAGHLTGDGPPAARVEATIRGLVDALQGHEHVYLAMLEARATSAPVRELWESDRESFVPVVAAVIDDERAAGRAIDGPPATALAAVLLELNDRALERLARGGGPTREEQVEALVHVWVSSIYGGRA